MSDENVGLLISDFICFLKMGILKMLKIVKFEKVNKNGHFNILLIKDILKLKIYKI
jgi:hypothetical protein